MHLTSTVYVVDDEEAVRRIIRDMCMKATVKHSVVEFPSAERFLEEYDDSGEDPRCLLLDIKLPGMTGIELQRRMLESKYLIPVILLTGAADVTTAVDSLQMGAADVLEKPVGRDALLAAVKRGIALDQQRREERRHRRAFQEKLATLSTREREVFELLIECLSIKQIAAKLDIGFQTAAKHRSRVLSKFEVQSDSELVLAIPRNDVSARIKGIADGDGEGIAGERLGQ